MKYGVSSPSTSLYGYWVVKVNEYYRKAKEIAESPELHGTGEAKEIQQALDYDHLDDHPSCWVPNVQAALLACFSSRPKLSVSKAVLELYIQGSIMESTAERNALVKVGFTCLALGFIIGWVVWS
ncbi:hypothetical protein [Microbulbifer sp. VAAF005]|uniref:hypothetical protein n=1 Tax=Microbulbifer sp. VAAF005 TaxID=3034230 RepID=UPI0024ADAE8B|nr:hypothetical protein [Microbulbifer sp. VAAF005]WHI47605.1 hypothetical protein P0078_04235 [Microbulbifer sp. VAAF005]